MTKYAKDCLDDIDKNAINWSPNYDGSLKEPDTLPVKYPNLIINGSYGIGQAYITCIPPHNFEDVADMAIKLIREPNTPIDYIAKNMLPDYPTGGVIINKSELVKAYTTGNGNVRIRAKITHTNTGDLLITQIPYMTTVGAILDKIQQVCKDEKIDGISDIIDQTNEKNGIRVLIKIKRGYDANVVEQQLYQLTNLQSTLLFSLIAVDGLEFKQYNIAELFHKWIDYRKTTIKRVFNFNMSKIRRRIHIIDGLLVCLNDIDNVIALIKTATDRKDTVSKLMSKYNLSDIQADAIADLQLHRLSSMSINELKNEKTKLTQDLNDYAEYFTDPNKLNDYIITQLEEGKEKYSRERRTTCVDVVEGKSEVEVPDTNHTIFVTKDGFVKKLTIDMRTNSAGCQGRSIGKMKNNDVIINAFNANNRDNLLVFTNMGRMFLSKVSELKDTNLNSYGILVNTYFNLKPNETVVSATAITDEIMTSENAFLVFVTRRGLIKRTMLSQYVNASKSGLIAIKLNDKDELVNVKECNGDMDVVIATANGGGTRFNTEEVNISLRNTIGVIGASLGENDHVVSFDVVTPETTHIFVVDTSGYGKLIDINGLQAQSRNNKCKLVAKLRNDDKLVSLKLVNQKQAVTIISANNMVKLNVADIPEALRSASSKQIFKLAKEDKVVDSYVEFIEG